MSVTGATAGNAAGFDNPVAPQPFNPGGVTPTPIPMSPLLMGFPNYETRSAIEPFSSEAYLRFQNEFTTRSSQFSGPFYGNLPGLGTVQQFQGPFGSNYVFQPPMQTPPQQITQLNQVPGNGLILGLQEPNGLPILTNPAGVALANSTYKNPATYFAESLWNEKHPAYVPTGYQSFPNSVPSVPSTGSYVSTPPAGQPQLPLGNALLPPASGNTLPASPGLGQPPLSPGPNAPAGAGAPMGGVLPQAAPVNGPAASMPTSSAIANQLGFLNEDPLLAAKHLGNTLLRTYGSKSFPIMNFFEGKKMTIIDPTVNVNNALTQLQSQWTQAGGTPEDFIRTVRYSAIEGLDGLQTSPNGSYFHSRGIQNQPFLRNHFNYFKQNNLDSFSDLHAHLESQGHTLAGQKYPEGTLAHENATQELMQSWYLRILSNLPPSYDATIAKQYPTVQAANANFGAIFRKYSDKFATKPYKPAK